MATIEFYAAGGAASGAVISSLGVGTWDHLAFYGNTAGSLLPIGGAQDSTWVADDAGATSGQINNNKWVDSSGVSIASGARINLSSVASSGSGTLNIRITNGSAINAQNALLYAYNGTDVNTGPSGVWVLSYEIIEAGASGTGDTQWALIDETNYNYLVDRTTTVGYTAATEFNYSVGLSVRPKLGTSSGITNFALRFEVEVI